MADATLRRLGGHALWRAWLVNNRGAIAMAGGRYPEALTALRESVQLKEQILGKDHPDVAISLGNVGWVLAKLHRIDESLAYGERAVAIDEKALGVDHPSTAVQLSNQADLLNLAGRFSEADGLARRALAIWEREEGADHPNAAFALTTIGRSSLGLGNVRDATSTLERAYSIRRNSDPDPANLAETEFLLAQTLWSKRASRQQALSLAVEAKNHYAQAANDDAAGEVAHWLATHDAY
jgi:tetratricopeptide (TPR) repeat protein